MDGWRRIEATYESLNYSRNLLVTGRANASARPIGDRCVAEREGMARRRGRRGGSRVARTRGRHSLKDGILCDLFDLCFKS